MSNNAPDYENDLVFPPASTDVHTTTIEKCERLEIQLGIVIEILLRECPQYEGYVKANFPNYKRTWMNEKENSYNRI